MNVYLNAISYYLPKNILSNKNISEQHPEWSVEKISQKLGIEERHIAAKDETASDLAYNAALKLIDEYYIEKSTIDYLIFCTQSPDYFLPTSACILQNKIGLNKNIGAIDFNLGCSGYVYGLGLAKALIESGQAENILFLTGETYTKHLNSRDKGNKSIFGDAGSATLISKEKQTNGINAKIKHFCYGTDGSQAEALIIRNGASRHPDKDGKDIFQGNDFEKNDNDLYMDGKVIFNFTAFQVPQLIKDTLIKNEMNPSDIDLYIFHQANEYMLNTVRKRCNIPEDQFYIDIKNYGNTVSNTIPIALFDAFNQGSLENKKNILIAGFGVGLSMGATILCFDE